VGVDLTCSPIVINQQPQSVDAAAGAPSILSVDASNPAVLTYAWFQIDPANPSSQANLLGITTRQATVSPTTTTSYSVAVSRNCNNGTTTVTTIPATVHVRSGCGITITAQPADVVMVAGTSASLSVTASASDAISYQWYSGDNGDTSHKIAGATLASLNVTPSVTTSYWVQLWTSSSSSCAIDSYSATVKVCHPPSVPTIFGSYASLVRGQVTTLSATVTGTALTYQWYLGAKGDTTNPIPYATWPSITINPQNTTTYWVRVSGLCGDPQDSTAVTITVCAVPVITQQPQSVSIFSGNTTTLTVTATEGTTTPITYQWYRGLSGDASHPVGTNSPSFTTPPLTEETSYWVAVTCDICGAGASNTATVSICPLGPTMSGPADQSIRLGQTAHVAMPPFSPATGNLFFWYQGASGDTSHPLGDYGGDWGPYNYIDVSPTVTTQYWAQVKNGTCVSSTSTTTVKVCVPSITTQPADIMINGGQSTTLTVVANTPGLTYQWYIGASGDTSSPISGAIAASYIATPGATTSYWVRVTGSCSQSVDSNTATVTICQPPSTITVSGALSIVTGYSTTLLASATGTNLTYQWYFGAAGDTSSPIYAGAQSITVHPGNQTNYWVRVTGACGTRDSATVTVKVCAVPSITTQPQSVSIFSGGTATLSVTAAESTTTPLTYQWYRGVSGDMSNPTGPPSSSPSYTTPALTTDTSYWVAVTADICGPTESDTATVSMCPLPQTMSGPADQSIALGQTAHLVIGPFSPPTGNTFFWYQGASGDTSHPLGDFGGDWGPYNYLDVSPAVTTQYWAQIKNGTCIANTTTTTVRVCIPTITTQPAGLMINSGQSTTLTVAANTPGLTYQWYVGTSGTTTSPVSGATSASFTTPALTTATSYWVRVTGTCGQSVDSNTATVTICQAPTAVGISGTQAITQGQSTTLTATSTGTSIAYQWYVGASGDTSTPIYAGAQSITVSPQNTANYWVRVTGTCGTRDSATVTVTVCAVPTITTQPQSVTILSGGSTTLSVTASEATTTPMTYQWYLGASGTTTSPISGATSPNYSTPALTTATNYWVRVMCGICGPTDSQTATVSMCPFPQTINGPADQNTTSGQSVRLTLVLSPSNNQYLWYQGLSGDTSHPLTGWQAANYLDVAPTVTTKYWAQVQNGTCVSNTTATTINVCIPTITTQPAGVMINSGQTTTLTVAANTAGLTYQWYRGASGDTSAPVGTNSASFTTPALTVTTSYWVKVTGTCGQSVSSSTATVTICQIPAITVQPAGTSLVRGYSTTLSVAATGTNLSYQWYVGTSGNTSSPVAGTSNSYTVTAPQNPVDYWVKVSGTCGAPVNSTTAHISVCTTPTINTQPQSSYIFSGGSATLSVSASEATGEALHYQWHRGTTSPVNVGTDSPTFNTGALTADTSYYVTVTAGTAGLCSVDSAAATVSICMYPQTVTGAPNQNTSPGQSVRLQLASNPGVTAYTWYRGASGDTSAPVTGWQAANYLDVAPTTTTSYWAQWQANSGACISNTTTTTVNVCIPVITQQPGSVTIASGSTTLSVTSNLPGSTYQWYVGASGTTTSPISGATAASVTVSPSSTTSYWCRVSGSCGTANSNTATVTICSPPVITQQPVTSASYPNYPNSLAVTATGTNLTYQWYYGTKGDTSNPFSGRTTNVLSLNLPSSTQYWVRVSGMCGHVDSNAAWISVYPTISQQPQQTNYLSQGSRGTVSLMAGGTGLHYQWFNASSGPVAGAPDSPTFITPDINATTSFYCLVSSAGGATTTSWTADFYLCDGVYIYGITVTNYGGNCRYLTASTYGSYDNVYWYQGQRGDTSNQVGSGPGLYVCPSTSTTYWFRATNTDQNQQVACYSDSPTVTVP
jgi:hypothetical protein